ncbi:MAG: hypothetical protein H0U39_12050 [Segetibacter sp.]|nr:hypothetical protein [Segetibacter sp.]
MKSALIQSTAAIFLICFVTVTGKAQIKRPHLLVSANVSYFNPQGQFADKYKFGAGGEISAGIGVDKTFLVATLGTSTFFAEDKIEANKLTVKPVKVGIRQFFLAKRLFINGDVGMANVKDKNTGISQNRFARGVGAGVRLFGLEGGLYYGGWKSVDESGFSNSVQVKIGWSMLL